MAGGQASSRASSHNHVRDKKLPLEYLPRLFQVKTIHCCSAFQMAILQQVQDNQGNGGKTSENLERLEILELQLAELMLDTKNTNMGTSFT